MGSDPMDFNILYVYTVFIDFSMAQPIQNRSKALATHIKSIDELMGSDTIDLDVLHVFHDVPLISLWPCQYKIEAKHEQSIPDHLVNSCAKSKSIGDVLGHSLCAIGSDTMDLMFLQIQ